MELICLFADEDKGFTSVTYERSFKNINSVFDFLEFEHPRVFKLFDKSEYAIVLQKDLESEPIAWIPGTGYEVFDFEYCFFVERIKGEFGFSIAAIAGLIIGAVGLTGTVLAGGALAIAILAVADLIAIAIIAGVMYGIGQIMQALSPTNTLDSSPYKNLNFGTQQNIQTQGTYIPYNLGEYICGGVVVGKRLDTYSIVINANSVDPILPKALPVIKKLNLSTAAQGKWFKLEND
jgi:hypothetical protein